MKTAHGAACGQRAAGGRVVFGRPSRFKGGGREKNNRKKLDIFLDIPRVQLFYIDEITSDYYANFTFVSGESIPLSREFPQSQQVLFFHEK